MISNDKLSSIIKDCNAAGYMIKVKDISYILLCRCYDDIAVAYKAIFCDSKTNAEIVDYHKSAAISFLRNYMDSNFVRPKDETAQTPKSKRKKSKGEDITFEENKAELIRMIKEIKEKEAKGLIDAKQSADLEVKLRIALNDKFKVSDDTKEQIVIVNAKYDDICPRCSCEIARKPISKEEAMKLYNLIDSQQNTL